MMQPLISSRRGLPLYNFQKKGFQFIHYHGACYLMLDMGMGKTRICIEVGRTLDYPLFVLAPKFAAVETWPDEFRKWNPHEKIAVLHGPNKERIWANSDKYTNIIMNYDGLKWFNKVAHKKLRPLQKYMFVFDEASMIKNWESNRWLILNSMKPIMSPYRVALSGTPTPQSLQDLWAQYHMLDEGKALGADYYGFRNRFFNYTGPDGDPPYQTTIKSFADTKIHELIKPITMRLKAEDYLDLPTVIYNHVKVTLPNNLRRKYNQIEDEFMLEFPTATVMANSSAVRDHKLRQFLQGAIYATPNEQFGAHHRLPAVTQPIHTIKAQVIKQMLETSVGKPLLVAVQFKFEIKILEKVLRGGRKIPAITGQTSGAEGKRLIQKWNRGEIPLMVVHPKSVAYSLNLQFGGNQVVWAALPWELDLFLQLNRRLVRPGQASDKVVITTIGFRDTVDDKVALYLRRKDKTQEGLFNAINEGR